MMPGIKPLHRVALAAGDGLDQDFIGRLETGRLAAPVRRMMVSHLTRPVRWPRLRLSSVIANMTTPVADGPCIDKARPWEHSDHLLKAPRLRDTA